MGTSVLQQCSKCGFIFQGKSLFPTLIKNRFAYPFLTGDTRDPSTPRTTLRSGRAPITPPGRSKRKQQTTLRLLFSLCCECCYLSSRETVSRLSENPSPENPQAVSPRSCPRSGLPHLASLAQGSALRLIPPPVLTSNARFVKTTAALSHKKENLSCQG
jgi:hypothetical protein